MANDRTPRQPHADHPITIEPARERIVVTVAGQVVADSKAALVLREAAYPPVYYIPRADAAMDAFTPTDHASYCPFKGEASYLSIPAGGDRAVNAIWSYREPYPWVAAIKDHLAFYPDRIDTIETRPLDS